MHAQELEDVWGSAEGIAVVNVCETALIFFLPFLRSGRRCFALCESVPLRQRSIYHILPKYDRGSRWPQLLGERPFYRRCRRFAVRAPRLTRGSGRGNQRERSRQQRLWSNADIRGFARLPPFARPVGVTGLRTLTAAAIRARGRQRGRPAGRPPDGTYNFRGSDYGAVFEWPLPAALPSRPPLGCCSL